MKANNPPLTVAAQQVDAQGVVTRYAENLPGSGVELVPQFTSRITRDFDQLFNQLINAMSQRMINHIGLYRFT